MKQGHSKNVCGLMAQAFTGSRQSQGLLTFPNPNSIFYLKHSLNKSPQKRYRNRYSQVSVLSIELETTCPTESTNTLCCLLNSGAAVAASLRAYCMQAKSI